MNQTIIRKFIFLAIIALCANSYAGTSLEWSMSLHLFGKQRMYTQQMCKEVLLIAKGVDIKKHQYHLQKTLYIFDRTLQGLMNGDKQLHLLKSDKPDIIQQLNVVNDLWQEFRTHIKAVLAGDTSLTVLKKIADQNMPLFENLNKALNLYEKSDEITFSKTQALTINLMGKQRMLTQKMIKEFLLVENGIAVDENKKKMTQTMQQFEHTLHGLLNGNKQLRLVRTKNGAIRSKLKAVIKIWSKYKLLLNQNTLSQEALLILDHKNMALLKAMDNTVKMYISFLR
ncbi:MAG: type IV pili methyl-accepting chemotaxis transducer N-terminal domain-containing protein [Thiomargarita sp.]|nr:type IV pili methyl-accepting chemotaxis transducer N-terminal domain-containing protein [Thiomargarita sp.]